MTEPSPGTANTAAPVAPVTQLAVNEFLVRSETGNQWIEVHNRDATLPVALTGITVQTGGAAQTIRNLSFLPPSGYARIFLGEPGLTQALDLTLPLSNGSVVLFGPNGAQLNSLAYSSTVVGISQGRLPDGTGGLTNFPNSPPPAAPNALLSYRRPDPQRGDGSQRRGGLDPSGDWPDSRSRTA